MVRPAERNKLAVFESADPPSLFGLEPTLSPHFVSFLSGCNCESVVLCVCLFMCVLGAYL